MTVRERNLLAVFLVLLVGGLGSVILVRQWLWNPLQEANAKIDELSEDIDSKNTVLRTFAAEQKRLEKYKALSLPSSPDQAASDYAIYLNTLLRNNGLTGAVKGPQANNLKVTLPQGKKAGHIILPFNVSATGDMAGVVKTLAALKQAPIAHRVRNLALAPADKDLGKLSISMTIEALIVSRADGFHPLLTAPDSRLVLLETVAGLRGAPLGMALGPWMSTQASVKALVAQEEKLARNYLDIPNRNVFAGANPEVVVPTELIDGGLDVRAYIKLVHTDPPSKEAFLRNSVFKTPELRLRAKKGSGYDTFRITNEDRDLVLLKGKVLRVDQRDVYFQVGEEIYGIHIGHSLADAMRRPLFLEELEDLQLTSLYDEDWAKQEMTPKRAKTPIKGKTPAPPKKKL